MTAPPSSCSPRTGYIQRRFSAASFWYPHFEQSVTAFASLSPLPPFIFAIILRYSAAPREFFLRRLRQPRSSGSEGFYCERDFSCTSNAAGDCRVTAHQRLSLIPARRPRAGAIREGFRLRRFVMHSSNVSVRLSANCVIPLPLVASLPSFIFCGLRPP